MGHTKTHQKKKNIYIYIYIIANDGPFIYFLNNQQGKPIRMDQLVNKNQKSIPYKW